MNLFEEICSYNNLLLAFDKVEENAGAPGVDHVTIEEFSIGLEEKLICLRKELLNGTYKSDALLKVGIPKENGKIRWLSIPTVRDRIVQTSASTILSPILDKEFEECSFAYRKDRSVQKAIQKIIDFRDRGYLWVVDADISSYFDEIDHDILMGEVKRYVNDENVIRLIQMWLKADIVYKGQRTGITRGVPQGSPISPLLSNLYLDTFDEALLKAKHKLVRFADDFVILCKNKPDAEDALELTEDVLKKLKLQLNIEKTRLIHFNQGFRYLGVEFLRSMVFRPVYEDKSKIEKEIIEPIRPPTFKPEKSHSASEIPDTIMVEAFKKAFKESGESTFDEFFDEKPVIEPSASGNPFLRTLYLLEQGTILRKENERFLISKDKTIMKEIPAIKVDQILVFGNIQITTQAMKFCIEENIPIILLSSRGKYFGTIESFKGRNVVLHKLQFELADKEKISLEIGKAIVKAKINNSKVLIQRYVRKRRHLSVDSEIQRINILLNKVSYVSSRDELMGVEGAASAAYFSALKILLGEIWGFKKRQKQPPPDPVNSLLSYGYTLLFYNIYAMIRMHGLHPYIGFFHGLRDGHPSLVSDILEEFRAPIVDAIVLNLILRGSDEQLKILKASLETMIDIINDHVRFYYICKKDSSRIALEGSNTIYKDEDYFMV